MILMSCSGNTNDSNDTDENTTGDPSDLSRLPASATLDELAEDMIYISYSGMGILTSSIDFIKNSDDIDTVADYFDGVIFSRINDEKNFYFLYDSETFTRYLYICTGRNKDISLYIHNDGSVHLVYTLRATDTRETAEAVYFGQAGSVKTEELNSFICSVGEDLFDQDAVIEEYYAKKNGQ